VVPSGVLSVYYDKICLKFASHHFLSYAVYICQKSLNFIYAFNCYQQIAIRPNVSWPHFSWPTLYRPAKLLLSAYLEDFCFGRLMHLELFGLLQPNYWVANNGWPLAKYWGARAPGAPRIDVPVYAVWWGWKHSLNNHVSNYRRFDFISGARKGRSFDNRFWTSVSVGVEQSSSFERFSPYSPKP